MQRKNYRRSLLFFFLFVRAIFVIARIHSLNFVEQFSFYLKLQSIWTDWIEASNNFERCLTIIFFAPKKKHLVRCDAVNFLSKNTKTLCWSNKSSLSIKWTWIIVLSCRLCEQKRNEIDEWNERIKGEIAWKFQTSEWLEKNGCHFLRIILPFVF